MGHVEVADPVPGRAESALEPVATVKPAPVDRVEAWAARKHTPAWLFRAAAVGARWECGECFDPCLVTEAEYDRAVAFADNPHAVINPPKEP